MNELNSILNKLYTSVESEGFLLLEKSGYIDKTIFDISPLNIICSDKMREVITLFVLSIIFIFIIFFSVKVLLLLYSGDLSTSIYSFAMKVIFIAVISSNSFSICKEIVGINADITQSLDMIFKDYTDKEIRYTNLNEEIDTIEEFLYFKDSISVHGIGKGILCFFVISMNALFCIRYVLVILCIILSPFCILFSIADKTQIIFRRWLCIFLSNLCMQNINKLLLFISIISKGEKEVAGIIIIGVVIIMYRINKKVGDTIFWKE